MNRLFFGIIALLILTACGNSKQSKSANEDSSEESDSTRVEKSQETAQYDCTDAISFGLNGKVKNVDFQIYHAYEDNGELSVGSLYERGNITFNEQGCIVVDEWMNEFGYDANGNYYRGNHIYTTIQRDKYGRVVKYNDVDPKGKSDVYNIYTFKYDKSGRLASVSVKRSNEVWTEKRQYKGGNIYPESANITCTFEDRDGYYTLKKYLYQHTDTYGNWTERTIVISNTEGLRGRHSAQSDTIIPDSVLPSSVAPGKTQSPKVNDEIQIEKRIITYYE